MYDRDPPECETELRHHLVELTARMNGGKPLLFLRMCECERSIWNKKRL